MIENKAFSKELSSTATVKKILLIGLPVVLAPDDMNLDKGNVLHLGLAYIGAILRDHGYEVKILDCYAEDMLHQRKPVEVGYVEYGISNEQILEQVRRCSPDLIGFTVPNSCQQDIAHSVARLIKKSYPKILIVAGGNHVTALPDKMDKDCFDYLIIGEGEYSILHLIDDINHHREGNEISRVYPNGDQHSNYITNLDDLPFPALDLMPLSKLWHGRRRWINMVATRGCLYNCNFCSIHTIMGYSIRRRSVDNVIAEILKWEKEYQIQEIFFEDDNLTTYKQWAKELFQRIADLNLGIRFYARNGIRADSVDKELLLLMRAAGFQDFYISPESGSQRTLDEIIGKKMKLSDCENAIRLAKEVSLDVHTFFVVGFPDETWEDLETTLKYARHLKELGALGFWFSTATPYPGTRLFNECVERGLIDVDHLDYRRLRTPDYIINHPIFSREELLSFRKKAMEEFSLPRYSMMGKIRKGISLLRRDPAMFYTKLRYKLNIFV